jgi:hypothetical protein
MVPVIADERQDDKNNETNGKETNASADEDEDVKNRDCVVHAIS